MHHSYIDRYAQGHSAIHALDARVKLAAVLAYSAVLVSFGRYALLELAPLAVLPLGMLWLGDVPVRFALRRAAVLSPFILTLAALAPLYDRQPVPIALGPWQGAAAGGWLTAGSVAVRFTLGVLALTALMSTTPFGQLLAGMRRLGCPRVLVMQLGLLYRYLFLLVDQAMRVRRGRDFRGAARAPARRRLQAVGAIIGQLFVRSLDRADRVHLAMTARGYRGEPRPLAHPHLHGADGVFAVLVALYLVACRWGSGLIR